MLRNLRLGTAFTSVALVVHASTTLANDQVSCTAAWRPGDGIPGVDGFPVLAATSWDPDGPGPLPPQLVVGGEFGVAGGSNALNVATFDGSAWKPLGDGFDQTVQALTVWNGMLVAGGRFGLSGSTPLNRIAMWNGSSWVPLGSGIEQGVVNALAVYNGELIASGNFAIAGGAPMRNIARWNGATWQPLGSGAGTSSNSVFALTIYDSNLVAGGDFLTAGGVSVTRVAKWDGANWARVSGADSTVRAMCTHNTNLMIVGDLGAIQFNGTNNQYLGVLTNVKGVASYAGSIFIGGFFFIPDGNTLTFDMARWDGSAWRPLGIGMRGLSNAATVYCLTTHDGKLIAGGNFAVAGGKSARNVAQWDLSSWSSIGRGTDARVITFGRYNGKLVAGGEFNMIGGTDARKIAWWDGAAWQTFGTGFDRLNDQPQYVYIQALAEFNGKLIAAGSFGTAGGVPAKNIAQWNGASWQPLGPGMDDGFVTSLSVYQGKLIAGGGFKNIGGVLVGQVAQWDGASWQPMSAGLPESCQLNMLAVEGAGPVGAGYFNNTDPLRGWDGSQWNMSGLDARGCSSASRPIAYAAVIHNGHLEVGGEFCTPTGVPRGLLFGGGLNGTVRALGSYQGDLIAGGAFNLAGGVPANGIARRQDSAGGGWSALGAGMTNVLAIDSFNGDLFVGGDFRHASDSNSAFLARWRLTPEPPSIAQQPAPRKISVGGSASFHVTTFGGQPQTYQWRKNGATLTDDAHITGALTDTLNISTVSLVDNGLYDCVITNACGAATSNQARLTVIGQAPTFNPIQPIGPGNPG